MKKNTHIHLHCYRGDKEVDPTFYMRNFSLAKFFETIRKFGATRITGGFTLDTHDYVTDKEIKGCHKREFEKKLLEEAKKAGFIGETSPFEHVSKIDGSLYRSINFVFELGV